MHSIPIDPIPIHWYPYPMPNPYPLTHTLEFLEATLPRRRQRILEVGCGTGLLARELRKHHDVTAIDRSDAALRGAKKLGIPIEKADFFTYSASPFDAVLFCRSLHHLFPLARVLDRTVELLKPGGVLIAEEFAHNAMDRATAQWFFDASRLLEASELLKFPDWHHELPEAPLARWKAAHRHHTALHTDTAMLRGIRKRFKQVRTWRLEYLYRYFSDWVESTPRGRRIVEWIRQRERGLKPIGLRVVARKTPSPR